MNTIFKFAFIFLVSSTLTAQKITSENYFDYFSKGNGLKGKKLTTAWVDEFEVAKILKEEMENAKFEWISTYRIVKLEEDKYVIAICFSEKSKVGFLYEGSHNMYPTAKTRNSKSMYKDMTGNDYAEKIVSINGDATFLKIKEVPSNLYIIKKDPYWYQFTENSQDDKVLVTKDIIYEIFRADIRKVVADFKK